VELRKPQIHGIATSLHCVPLLAMTFNLLIATTNQGKFKEIATELSDLPFKFLSLNDIKKKVVEPEETERTLEGNAILKAKYYGEKTGLLTMSEDTGLFIKALKGWPGVSSARVANTDKKRKKLALQKMKDVKDRKAVFQTSMAVYNPLNKELHLTQGETNGQILKKEIGNGGFGYDAIFYFPKKKKTYAEMATLQKNVISHRGKALFKMKYYLMNQFSYKQLVVPAGVIVKDGKMLMTKRRDLRPKFNNKWELPGGGVDNGEEIKEALIREIKEETGYNVKIVEQLPEILTKTEKENAEYGSYQVFLIMYICKIKSGKFKTSDAEINGHGWFTIQEALKKPLLPLNKKYMEVKENMEVLKKYIKY